MWDSCTSGSGYFRLAWGMWIRVQSLTFPVSSISFLPLRRRVMNRTPSTLSPDPDSREFVKLGPGGSIESKVPEGGKRKKFTARKDAKGEVREWTVDGKTAPMTPEDEAWLQNREATLRMAPMRPTPPTPPSPPLPPRHSAHPTPVPPCAPDRAAPPPLESRQRVGHRAARKNDPWCGPWLQCGRSRPSAKPIEVAVVDGHCHEPLMVLVVQGDVVNPYRSFRSFRPIGNFKLECVPFEIHQ